MFCESCGKEMPDDTKFCANCGAKVEIEKSDQPVSTPPPADANARPAAAVPPVVSPPPVQNAPPPPPPPVQQYNTSQPKSTPPQRANIGVPPLSVGQYLGMIIIASIPIVGIIMLLVWGFGSGGNPNKKNFAIAYLIIMAIVIVLTIISSAAIIGIISSLAGSMTDFM